MVGTTNRADEDDEGDEMSVSDAAEDLDEVEDSGGDVDLEPATIARRKSGLKVGFHTYSNHAVALQRQEFIHRNSFTVHLILGFQDAWIFAL